ncbi:MAG: hypothetical protein MZW92_75920 [Comamonadaceae bacterium]|nr:hypothetical protein [Comamonadaceae bacterium]
MKTVPPDSIAVWDANGYRTKQVWAVQPSQDRWEAGRDDLVDEMHELSHAAIADVLKNTAAMDRSPVSWFGSPPRLPPSALILG